MNSPKENKEKLKMYSVKDKSIDSYLYSRDKVLDQLNYFLNVQGKKSKETQSLIEYTEDKYQKYKYMGLMNFELKKNIDYLQQQNEISKNIYSSSKKSKYDFIQKFVVENPSVRQKYEEMSIQDLIQSEKKKILENKNNKSQVKGLQEELEVLFQKCTNQAKQEVQKEFSQSPQISFLKENPNQLSYSTKKTFKTNFLF